MKAEKRFLQLIFLFLFVMLLGPGPLLAQRHFVGGTLFEIFFDPRTPDDLRAELEREEELLSRGPLRHQAIRAEALREAVLTSDIEALFPLLRQLKLENPRFQVKNEELLLSFALSRILSEQMKAYSKFPWIRKDRIHFARARLLDFALAYPRMSSRFYFAAQQLSNRMGIFFDWYSLTHGFQKLFQKNGVLWIRIDGIEIHLDIRQERELFEGLFVPGNFMIAYWALQNIFKQLKGVENELEVLRAILKRLDLDAAIDPRLFDAEFELPEVSRRIMWDYSSARLQSISMEGIAPFQLRLGSLVEIILQAHRVLTEQDSSDRHLSYVVQQVLSRVGSSLSVENLNMAAELGISGLRENFPALKDFVRDESLPIGLDLLVFLSRSTKGLTEDLLLDLGDALGLKDQLLQAALKLQKASETQDDIWIDGNFSAVEQLPYRPKRSEAEFSWTSSNTYVRSFADLMREFEALYFALEKAWRVEGLDPFENSYHYLEFNRKLIVDFGYEDYKSRTHEIKRRMEEGQGYDPLPLSWEPITMSWNGDDLPGSEAEFTHSAYLQLNRVYISKMQSKILRLWGFDFDRAFKKDLQNSTISFQDEIRPRYEDKKEDRFREMEVAFSVMSFDLPSYVSIEAAHERLWEIFESDIERQVLLEAAKVFQPLRQDQGTEAARAGMLKALEDSIRQSAFENFGAQLTISLELETAPVIRHLPVFSGNREEVLRRFENMYGSGNRLVTAEGALLGYQNSSSNDSLLVFPIYVRPPESFGSNPNQSKEVFVVLLRVYRDKGLISFYDVQNDIQDEIQREKNLGVASGLVARLLGRSVGHFNPNSNWLQISPNSEEARGPARTFVQAHLRPDNVEKILYLASEIEHFRIASTEAWNDRAWRSRRVNDRGALGAISSGVAR